MASSLRYGLKTLVTKSRNIYHRILVIYFLGMIVYTRNNKKEKDESERNKSMIPINMVFVREGEEGEGVVGVPVVEKGRYDNNIMVL